MAIYKRESFSTGEVDEELFNETGSPEYAGAMQLANGVFVNDKAKITKRYGSELIHNEPFKNTSRELNDYKTVVLRNSNNYYHVLFTLLGTSLVLQIIELNIGVDIEYSNSAYSKIPDFDSLKLTNLGDLTIIPVADYIVFMHHDLHPKELRITNKGGKISFKVRDIPFKTAPTVDSGRVDYREAIFIHDKSASTITVEYMGDASAVETLFDPSIYAGGQILGPRQESVYYDTNIGIAEARIISVTAASAAMSTATPIKGKKLYQQTFSINTKDTFSATTKTSSDSTSIDWAVLEPMWSDKLGYPRSGHYYGDRFWVIDFKSHRLGLAASSIGDGANFNVGSGRDDEAIALLLSSGEGGQIDHIYGGTNLHIWTNTRILTIFSKTDVGITPENAVPQNTDSIPSNASSPIKHKGTVFYASNAKNQIYSLIENNFEVLLSDVSQKSRHLINDPHKFVTCSISGSEDTLLYILNSDKTITVYSYTKSLSISAFTRATFSVPKGYEIITLDRIADQVIVVAYNNKTLLYMKLTPNKFLDSSTRIKDTDIVKSRSLNLSIITVPNFIENDDLKYSLFQYSEDLKYQRKVRIVSRGVGEQYHKCTASLPFGVKGPLYLGYEYPLKITTVPLQNGSGSEISSKSLNMLWVAFSDSAVIRIGNRTYLEYKNNIIKSNSESVSPHSAIIKILKVPTVMNGNTRNQVLTIESNYPYPFTLTGITYSIAGAELS